MPIAIYQTGNDDDKDLVKVSPPASVHSFNEKPRVSFAMTDSPAPRSQQHDNHPGMGSQLRGETAVDRVKHHSRRFQDMARPYGLKLREFAESSPVLFTFLAIFTALSFIPVCCFVIFTAMSTAFVLVIAACMICISTIALLVLACELDCCHTLFTS
jgi:hypothetical protein